MDNKPFLDQPDSWSISSSDGPYEGSIFTGSSRHDVSFQWWRYQPATRSWAPTAADYELPSGLLVLQLENAQGLGPGGVGYQLLRVTRR